jgi:hypothetical protein
MHKSLFALVAVLAAIAMPAQAVVINFDNEFSGGTDCATPVTGCSVLTATSIAGGVHFNFVGTMAPGEFITELSGNFLGAVAPTVANITGNTESFVSFAFAKDSFKADGDGFFDWKLTLDNAPPGNRFNGTDHLSWDFLGLTLPMYNSISVNGPEGKNGFLFATHAQGLAQGGSGWFNGQLAPGSTPFDVTPVPEPETYALFAAGLGMLGFMQRRRKPKQA